MSIDAMTNSPSFTSLGARNFRVGGAGFTMFHWMNKPIAFAANLSVRSAQPVAPPAVIQPIDAAHPLEILTTVAVGPIQLDVQLFQLYNGQVWDDIMKTVDAGTNPDDNRANVQSGGYHDLQSILARLANVGQGVSVTKFIYPPNKLQTGATKTQSRATTYHNVRIVDARDDEVIEIGTMEVIKSISMMATHSSGTSSNT